MPKIVELADEIRAGSRRALSKGITLIESVLPEHRVQAQELLDLLMPYTGNAIRIGVTGVPGVGKSSMIEALGLHILEQAKKVCVLAVDPSSTLSGGAILGDKTRMNVLSQNPNAYIRPSPTNMSLGGIARRSYETMLLCEAAGYEVVLVETVGVGQSETSVDNMTDMFVLMLLPGSGDELQGIKRGIVELADLILVNKADEGREAQAQKTADDYRGALKLLRPKHENWQVEILTASALKNDGIQDVWQSIIKFMTSMEQTGTLKTNRARQAVSWMSDEIKALLFEELEQNSEARQKKQQLESDVADGKLSPAQAADRVINCFLASQKD